MSDDDDHEVLEVPADGRVAVLGQIYNAATNEFIVSHFFERELYFL